MSKKEAKSKIKAKLQKKSKLADALAFNYLNNSIATSNSDWLHKPRNESKDHRKIIYQDHKQSKKFLSSSEFSRNILIIGAGASKNANENMLTAEDFIPELWGKLGLLKLLDENDSSPYKTVGPSRIGSKKDRSQIAKAIIRECFHYLRQTEDENLTFNELFGLLKMEGALYVAQKFVDKREISELFSSYLSYRYIPNLFYELVAHFFKHRIIDVIINLNFDELLDNSLEDEMGESEWIKIYDEATSSKLEEAVADGRLKKPVYIKPHGTISNTKSLLFSVSEYIDQSDAITELLEGIMMGRLGGRKSKRTVHHINLIFAGYSLNDVDIRELVVKNILANDLSISREELKATSLDHTQHAWLDEDEKKRLDDEVVETLFNTKDQLCKTRLYIFDLDPLSVHTSLENHFQEEPGMGYRYNKGQAIRKKVVQRFLKKCTRDFKLEKDALHPDNLNQVFYHLLKQIQECFAPPFVPSGPERHLFNFQVLHECFDLINVTKHDQKRMTGPSAELLLARAVANLAFEIMKHGGRLPFNVITANRVGKYYQLWLDKAAKNKDKLTFWSRICERSSSPGSIYDIIDEVAKDVSSTTEIVQDESYYSIKPIYELVFGSDIMETSDQPTSEWNKKVWMPLDRLLKKYVGKFSQDRFSSFRDLQINEDGYKYVQNVFRSGSHEINPHYRSQEYLRFHPVPSIQILNTNLALTWYFYYFTVLKESTWEHLVVVASTGNSVANLAKYQDDKVTHLNSLFKKNPKRTIKLMHTVEEPVFSKSTERNPPEEIRLMPLKDFFKDEIEPQYHRRFSYRPTKWSHKVALYLDRNMEPVHAIYFYHPARKNRINPVWFSTDPPFKTTSKENRRINKLNLKIIHDCLLPEEYKEGEFKSLADKTT